MKIRCVNSLGRYDLYGFNGFVRHPLHQALDIVVGTLPLVLIGMPIPVAVMLGFAIALQLIVQHSNVDYALGPVQKLLAIGPVHRLHHVNWAGEGDVNFGPAARNLAASLRAQTWCR